MGKKTTRKSKRIRERLRERMTPQYSEEVVEVKVPLDFRFRDYVLGEVLFMSLGFNVSVLQGKS